MKPLDTIRITLRTTAERIKEEPQLLLVIGFGIAGAACLGVMFYNTVIYPFTNPYNP